MKLRADALLLRDTIRASLEAGQRTPVNGSGPPVKQRDASWVSRSALLLNPLPPGAIAGASAVLRAAEVAVIGTGRGFNPPRLLDAPGLFGALRLLDPSRRFRNARALGLWPAFLRTLGSPAIAAAAQRPILLDGAAAPDAILRVVRSPPLPSIGGSILRWWRLPA
jgi:hypothetical protein